MCRQPSIHKTERQVIEETSMDIKRGELYYADLDPVIGSEQGGIRPVLILQNDTGNHFSPTIVVAAITSRRKHLIPTHVKLSEQKGLSRESFVMLEQIRTIDRERLKERIGSIDRVQMKDVNAAIKVSLGLNGL